jgi:hypothetical protein
MDEEAAAERAKATADAVLAAAQQQKEGLVHRVLNLVGDLIGINDAINCFTKGDVWGCINTGLNALPLGKMFKAAEVGYKAYKVWRELDKAYVAVKDAEEAARVADDAVKAEHAAVDAERAGEGAAGCPLHSFISTTAVRLADGSSKPISQVKTGDTVLATDPQTGVTAPEQVQNVIVTQTDHDFTTLTLDTTPVRGLPHHKKPSGSAQQTLTTTWLHPFWDATHHRWTDAHDLTPGTKLRQADGTTVVVTGIRNFHQHRTTYDLTVGKLHTYYVLAGNTPVLVHNTGCGITTTTEKAGDLGKYTEGQKTRDPASQWYHEELSNEELLDGINNPGEGDGILVSRDGTILGGHHRWDELQTRVRDGRIDPDTPIRVDVYDPE